jgi:hypothetical protein
MFALKINSNNNIKGLEIQGLKNKVYADDSCFILNPQKLNPSTASEDLDTFSNLSRLK